MNKSILIVVVVIILLILGWWAFYSYEQAIAPEIEYQEEQVENQETSNQQSQETIISLSEQNESGISGFAAIAPFEDKTIVVLRLQGNLNDNAYPVNIHFNSCNNLGEPGQQLSALVEGSSETVLDSKIGDLLGNSALSINIQNPEDINSSVACGELTK